MLFFHDEPVICENIITKILFSSCSAKISYRKIFRVYRYIHDYRGDSRNFDEWFLEQLQLSRQILGFLKGGAYFSSRSLKQGVCGSLCPPETIGLLYL